MVNLHKHDNINLHDNHDKGNFSLILSNSEISRK